MKSVIDRTAEELSGIFYGDEDRVRIEIGGQAVDLDFADTIGGVNGPAASAIISDVRAVLGAVARKIHELEMELMEPRA